MSAFAAIFLAALLVAALWTHRRTRREVAELRAALTALIAEMRAQGLGDVVAAARERATGDGAHGPVT